MIVLIDINVLVSAAIKKTSVPSLVVRMTFNGVLDGTFRVLRSDEMMERYDDVMRRPHLAQRIAEADREEFRRLILERTDRHEPDPLISGFADDDEDDIVLGTAVAGNADVIVTGDKGLLRLHPFRGIAIVNASEFLRLIESPGVP
jgi:putative PIN family toxin of toxin-antitoxin system